MMMYVAIALLTIQQVYARCNFGGIGLPTNPLTPTNINNILGGNGGNVIPIVPDDPTALLDEANRRLRTTPELQQLASNAANNPQFLQAINTLMNDKGVLRMVKKLVDNPQLQQRIIDMANSPRFRAMADSILNYKTNQVLPILDAVKQNNIAMAQPRQSIQSTNDNQANSDIPAKSPYHYVAP